MKTLFFIDVFIGILACSILFFSQVLRMGKLIFLYKQLKLSFFKVIIALTVAYAFPALVILKDKALTVA